LCVNLDTAQVVGDDGELETVQLGSTSSSAQLKKTLLILGGVKRLTVVQCAHQSRNGENPQEMRVLGQR
jgi:hypothetical protein